MPRSLTRHISLVIAVVWLAVVAQPAHSAPETDVEVVARLLTTLKSPDPSLRSSAAHALGVIGIPAAEGPLLEALKDPDATVRAAAAYALPSTARFGSPHDKLVVPALLKCILDNDSNVSHLAGFALYQMDDPSCVPELLSDLEGTNVTARASTRVPLSMLSDVKAIDRLLDDCQNTDAGVRGVAIEVLAMIRPGSDDRENHIVDRIINALQVDADVSVQVQAAEALGRIGSRYNGRYKRIGDALAAAQLSSDDRVKSAAFDGLAESADDRACQSLIDILNGTKPGVRANAAIYLGKQRSPSAVSALIGALNDSDPAIRGNARYALGQRCDGSAVEPLIVKLTDTHASVRCVAAELLSEMPDARAVELLTKASTDSDPAVQAAAKIALEKVQWILWLHRRQPAK